MSAGADIARVVSARRPLVLRASPDQALYCEWSSVVDAPVYVGDREAMAAWLLDYYSPHDRRNLGGVAAAEAEIEARLVTVDQRGTSAPGIHGAWEARRGRECNRDLIYLGDYWLPRDNLGRLLVAILAVPGSESPDPDDLVAAGIIERIES